MLNIHRALARWFPSVPPRDQAVVLAAMEGRTPIPVSSSLGEDAGETGQTPAADGTRPLAAAGTLGPGGEVLSEAASASASPPGPPRCETDLYWRPDPSRADEFTDRWLAHLLKRWAQA